MINSRENKDLPQVQYLSKDVRDQICDLLLKVWNEYYTNRFGQMLGNECFDRLFNLNKKRYWLLFDIPDEKLLEILNAYVTSGFKFSKKVNKIKFEMYSELIKDKVWLEKYNNIINKLDGSLVEIKDINVGDLILSFNKEYKLESVVVVAKKYSGKKIVIDIYL